MQIKFQSKEESKRSQKEAFLKLSGGERVWRFFQLCAEVNQFPTKRKNEKTGNFVIDFSKISKKQGGK